VRLVATVVCGVALLASVVAGSAQSQPSPVASVLVGLNPDGSGNLFAVGSGTSAQGWAWQSCRGSGTTICAPFAVGASIQTGDAASGTFFVASTGAGAIATSSVWYGNLTAQAPPRVYGDIRANAEITPIPATWSGGWQAAFASDSEQLAACADADGTDCTALTAPGYIYECAAGGAVIDPVFTGWYLRVADQHAESNEPEPVPVVVTRPPVLILSGSPYQAPVWQPNATTSVAVVGRIAPATGARVTFCGGPPLPATANPYRPTYRCPKSSQFFACPVATIAPTGEADIWCGPSSCEPSVQLRHGRRTVVLQPIASVQPTGPPAGPIIIRISRSTRARIGHGSVIESVYARGALLARRRIMLS